jgi:protein-tyrosine phosphatase
MFDLHCHLLPGLDDGAADLEQSLKMARIAVEDGVRGVVCTPHWLTAHYENGRDAVMEATQRLQTALSDQHIPLQIYPGAELRLDTGILEGIRAGALLTLNDTGRFVLLELPDLVNLQGLEDFIYDLRVQGITPILSHPERNYRFQSSPARLYELVHLGALTQLTAGSVIGHFGKEIQKFSVLLIKHRMAHILASDAHGASIRTPRLARACRAVEKMAGRELAWRMVSEIPQRVIHGRAVEVPEPIAFQTSRFHFWKWACSN